MTEEDTFNRLCRISFEEMTKTYHDLFDHSGLSDISKEDFFKWYNWNYKDWEKEYWKRLFAEDFENE